MIRRREEGGMKEGRMRERTYTRRAHGASTLCSRRTCIAQDRLFEENKILVSDELQRHVV